MISIGKRVHITDDLNSIDGCISLPKGAGKAFSTFVFFDGEPVGGLQEIKMHWDADTDKVIKQCFAFIFEDQQNNFFEFATEMANNGFLVRATNLNKDIFEWYLKDGNVIAEKYTGHRKAG